MKSKKRKELELQALLQGFTVTYGPIMPSHPEIGNRHYSTDSKTYYIACKKPDTVLRLLFGLTAWKSVGSKRFFDTSDIK